jgi:hypothetical protein
MGSSSSTENSRASCPAALPNAGIRPQGFNFLTEAELVGCRRKRVVNAALKYGIQKNVQFQIITTQSRSAFSVVLQYANNGCRRLLQAAAQWEETNTSVGPGRGGVSNGSRTLDVLSMKCCEHGAADAAKSLT